MALKNESERKLSECQEMNMRIMQKMKVVYNKLDKVMAAQAKVRVNRDEMEGLLDG
jgi:hypothetical protein